MPSSNRISGQFLLLLAKFRALFYPDNAIVVSTRPVYDVSDVIRQKIHRFYHEIPPTHTLDNQGVWKT